MREEVGEEAVCAGDSCRQLPEEGEAGVDEAALAHRGNEQTTLAVGFARIVHGQERRVVRIPRVGKVEAALLHPAVEVVDPDAVGRLEDGVLGLQQSGCRRLVGPMGPTTLLIQFLVLYCTMSVPPPRT